MGSDLPRTQDPVGRPTRREAPSCDRRQLRSRAAVHPNTTLHEAEHAGSNGGRGDVEAGWHRLHAHLRADIRAAGSWARSAVVPGRRRRRLGLPRSERCSFFYRHGVIERLRASRNALQ